MQNFSLYEIQRVADEIEAEVVRAICLHPNPFNSPHEGHSVIREELDELWEHVRANTGRTAEARKEAIQIGAVALRYALQLTPRPPGGTGDDI